jgi:hypothetical protein
MKLLSKIGQIVLKTTQLLLGFGPLINSTFPDASGKVVAVVDKLTEISDVIIKVEVFGQALNLQGSDKLKAAGPMVAQIILSSAILADKKIADPVLFARGCTNIAGGMADVLNSLKDKVEVVDHQ